MLLATFAIQAGKKTGVANRLNLSRVSGRALAAAVRASAPIHLRPHTDAPMQGNQATHRAAIRPHRQGPDSEGSPEMGPVTIACLPRYLTQVVYHGRMAVTPPSGLDWSDSGPFVPVAVLPRQLPPRPLLG
jgi:hypothetical protein